MIRWHAKTLLAWLLAPAVMLWASSLWALPPRRAAPDRAMSVRRPPVSAADSFAPPVESVASRGDGLHEEPSDQSAEPVAGDLDAWLQPLRGNSLRLVLLLGLVSLAPAALLMTTSYVRIVVVLSLLKQALGNQQALPAQATTALALFMTALVMTPVWQEVYSDAIAPYRAEGSEMSASDAWSSGVQPVRRFMSRQIDHADNSEDVWLFFRYLPAEQQSHPPQTYEDVPLQVLLPAFLLSELKTAFLIGFQIYLPFLVLDFVVATVTTSMGLNMMQPATVSLPFKLLLFVLVDGWRLVAGTLLESFAGWSG